MKTERIASLIVLRGISYVERVSEVKAPPRNSTGIFMVDLRVPFSTGMKGWSAK
jgi:hypothetical protein